MTFTLSSLRNTKLCSDLAFITRQHSVLISPTSYLGEGGSGTLIKYKNFFGILTATHVIADQININAIYSPILKTSDPTYFLNALIPIKSIIHLETSEGIAALRKRNWAEGALDICLINLEKNVFDAVLNASGKQAVDLCIYKDKYNKDFEKYCSHNSINNWSWAIEGSPREEVTQGSQGILESRYDGMYLCGGSKDDVTYRTQPLTLVRQPFDKDADISCHELGPSADALPSKFSGISGGGMWQVSFYGENGEPKGIEEIFFAGLCVCETEKSLHCRGPESLYQIFIAYLETML